MSSPTDRLSEGALDWLADNLEYFNPYSARARSSAHGKVKAALELALLCHCWTRLGARGDRLGKATALIRMLWRRPDFEELVATHSDYALQYGLIYTALAPDAGLCRAMLNRLASAGYLSPLGKSPYQRLETRYYADKAGIAHEMEPNEELIELSPLVRLPAEMPPTDPEAYAITHSSFYLSDFGRKSPGLNRGALARAESIVHRMLDDYVRRDKWDLAAELVITQFCLGHDPLATSSGAAAIQCLARAQLPNGAIPGRSAAQRAVESASAAEFFENSYHTTLVTALMSLVVSSA